MSYFAFYRLPYAQDCTFIHQVDGEPERLRSCRDLNGKKGFVIAPFHVADDQPILLLRPDDVSHISISQKSDYSFHHTVEEQNFAQDYAADFARFHAELEQGHFSKLVLARKSILKSDEPNYPEELFYEACRRYPRMFVALVWMPDGTLWLTATPEILLEGSYHVWRTIALAGTMSLAGDELQGEGEHIRWSPKNIQEQRYVASYIGDCLKRFGIDYREEGPRTVRAANLVHLRSDFNFNITHPLLGDLLEALHPTPAVCGLPKAAALDFILGHEHTDRQYYSGFMGPLGIEDATHLYVSLRCMHICDNTYHLYAGGGLLKDSQPDMEWQETEAKMQTMKGLFGEK